MAKLKRFPSPSDVSVQRYLDEIGLYRPLANEEERELARRIRQGDQGARDRLICANLPFVATVAKEYLGYGLPLADLIAEGNVGLMEAAVRFDETRGVKFISYAVWWIRQAIRKALADTSRTVRLPITRIDMIGTVIRTSQGLSQELGRTATLEELSEKTGLTPKQIQESILLISPPLSLDSPIKEADPESENFYYLFKDEEAPSPEDDGEMALLTDKVSELLTDLPGREAEVIRLYFGLDGRTPLTLEQIGERYGVSRERTRQIRNDALAHLRHVCRKKKLLVHFESE